MTKHTPGPWKIIRLDNEVYINPDRESGEYALIARINGTHRRDSQEANARLIAAAPELLEALKECHTRIFNDNAGLDELRDPEVTKVLNSLALEAAERAIRKAEEKTR